MFSAVIAILHLLFRFADLSKEECERITHLKCFRLLSALTLYQLLGQRDNFDGTPAGSNSGATDVPAEVAGQQQPPYVIAQPYPPPPVYPNAEQSA